MINLKYHQKCEKINYIKVKYHQKINYAKVKYFDKFKISSKMWKINYIKVKLII